MQVIPGGLGEQVPVMQYTEVVGQLLQFLDMVGGGQHGGEVLRDV